MSEYDQNDQKWPKIAKDDLKWPKWLKMAEITKNGQE